jgi:uncharacterized protein (DUF488 family)
MKVSKLFTIGFTKKTAEQFFLRLRQSNVKRILDVRLNNSSQLAGFTKRHDFEYFLKEIGRIDYVHLPQLCPTKEILKAYKDHALSWEEYEEKFTSLLMRRHVENTVGRDLLNYGCLLCSEDKPDLCHRRLVGRYLLQKLGNIEIVDL